MSDITAFVQVQAGIKSFNTSIKRSPRCSQARSLDCRLTIERFSGKRERVTSVSMFFILFIIN